MAKRTPKDEHGRSGPPALFHDKVMARRSGVMTSRGNVAFDEFRVRMGAALSMGRPLSVGDAIELLVHAEVVRASEGMGISGRKALEIAEFINNRTAKDATT
jgi:hypothetical protein